MNAPLSLNPADVLIAEYERFQIEGIGFLRNPQAEAIILQDVHNSLYYSVHVLQGRWPEFEAALWPKSVKDYDAADVGYYLDELTGDFSIKYWASHQDVIAAIDRAPKVSRDGESTFTTKKTRLATVGETYDLVDREYDPEPYKVYQREKNRRHQEGDGFARNLEAEETILKDPFYAVWYANHVLKHRWPELERRLENVPDDYRWHSGTAHLAADAMIKYNLEIAQRPIKAVERLIYSFKTPENINDPDIKRRTHGAAYDAQKRALFPGSNSTSVEDRVALDRNKFWSSSASYRDAVVPSSEASLKVEEWQNTRLSRALGNIEGILDGISGGAKGVGIIIALPVIRWFTSFTLVAAVADIVKNGIKVGRHGHSLFSSKEYKQLKELADHQDRVLQIARYKADQDARFLAGEVANAINSAASAAFQSHYALQKSAAMLSDRSPALAGYHALAFLERELGKVDPIYANSLESAVETLSYEFKYEPGRTPFELRHQPMDANSILTVMSERLMQHDAVSDRQEELSRVFHILESANLLLDADAKLAHILFERSGRSDLPADTKMLLLPHEDFKDVVKAMIEGEADPYSREIKVADRPAKTSDIHDELEAMSLLIRARAKSHPHLVSGVDEQLNAISEIKSDLAKIEAKNLDHIQLNITLRSPSEYLLKLSEHVKTHVRRLELRDDIRPALEGKLDAPQPALSTKGPRRPKW